MLEGSWANPPLGQRLATCGVIAAMHVALLMSYDSRKTPVPGDSFDGNRTIFLVPPRVTPPVIQSDNIKKASPRLPQEKRMAITRPGQRESPDEVAANGNVSAIENTAEADPNWTTGQSGKSAPITDIEAYSLSLAGKADAAIRQGKPVTLDPADTPLRRMQSRMAQAATGGGNSTTTAISSSGESITIITRGGRMHCYVPVSTSVAPSAVFDNRGSGRSTEIRCPKGLR